MGSICGSPLNPLALKCQHTKTAVFLIKTPAGSQILGNCNFFCHIFK